MERCGFVYWRDESVYDEELAEGFASRFGRTIVDRFGGEPCDSVFYVARNEFPSPELASGAREFNERGEYYVRLVDVVLDIDKKAVRNYVERGCAYSAEVLRDIYSIVTAGVRRSVELGVQNLSYVIADEIKKYNVYRLSVLHEYRKAVVNRGRVGVEFVGFPYYYVRVRTLLDIYEWSFKQLLGTEVGREILRASPVIANSWRQLKGYLLDLARASRKPRWLFRALRKYSGLCGRYGISKYVHDAIRWVNAIFSADIPFCSAGELYGFPRLLMPDLSLSMWGVHYDRWLDFNETWKYYTTEVYSRDPSTVMAVIARMYDAILRRPPDTDGLLNYTYRVIEGKMSIKDVADALMDSDEYRQRIGAQPIIDSTPCNADALPQEVFNIVKKYGSEKVRPNLLVIGCLDMSQLAELSELFDITVLSFTDGACGATTDAWLSNLPNQQYSVAVITKCAWDKHPFPKYLLTTAHALLTNYGLLILPTNTAVEGLRLMKNDEYAVFKKAIILT